MKPATCAALLMLGACPAPVVDTAHGEPALSFDPADKQYPFKSRNPRKLWLKAVDQGLYSLPA